MDQSGSSTSGTFTVDVTGESHLTDSGSGSGGNTTTSGNSKADLTYHIVYGGHKSTSGMVIDSVTYTDNGTYSSSVNVAVVGVNVPYAPPTTTSHYLGTRAGGFTTSYTSQLTNGAWTLLSYSSNANDRIVQDSDARQGVGPLTVSHNDVGYVEVGTKASAQQVNLVGSNWAYTTGSVTIPGSPPTVYSWVTNNFNTPYSTTDSFGPDLTQYGTSWKTEDPNAIGYTWHGESKNEGTLNQTTVATNSKTDVSSFTITGKNHVLAHIVEDEPTLAPVGGGSEQYHKDELYEGGETWNGSGSIMNGVYVGTYHVGDDAHFNAHDIAVVSGNATQGIDEYGTPYSQTYNSINDRVSQGTYTVSHDYDDNNSGALVTGSNYSFSDGTTSTSSNWGTFNNVAYNNTNPLNEANGGTWTMPATTKRIDWLLPTTDGASDDLVIGRSMCQYIPKSSLVPPKIPGIPHPGGGLRATPGLQNWYNGQVQKIGEDAKLKVGKLVAQDWVMKGMNDEATTNGGKRFSTGTITTPGKGETFAQASGLSKQLDAAEKAFEKSPQGKRYKGLKFTVDVELQYQVVPAPGANQNRPGTVIVKQNLIVKWEGTNRATGVKDSGTASILGKDGWFQDDNLKTTDLFNR